jgi:hypothetical protein
MMAIFIRCVSIVEPDVAVSRARYNPLAAFVFHSISDAIPPGTAFISNSATNVPAELMIVIWISHENAGSTLIRVTPLVTGFGQL